MQNSFKLDLDTEMHQKYSVQNNYHHILTWT